MKLVSLNTVAWLLFATLVTIFPTLAQDANKSPDQPRSPNPHFEFQRIGPKPFFRPAITNVQITDLNQDGQPDVIVCDAQAQAVFCYHRREDGTWEEQLLAEGLIAPAHATIVDLDQDGDMDVLVSVMGNLFPDDGVIGSLVLLENQNGQFKKKTLLDDVRRVVDAQPGDFDGDGDLDLAVAVFGYARGEILWLENRGYGAFRDHRLHLAPGTIHVPVHDYDGDGDLDIIAIVSQDDEEVWAFENLGEGDFSARRLWMTHNFDIGSAGLVATDLDGDGDQDLLLPVGDNLEDRYSIAQPYHGCLWLENRGNWDFPARRIASFPGTYAAASGDLDSDGDQDVLLCSMVNDWEDPEAASLVWLENDGQQSFTQHTIAREPIMLTTLACDDLNLDERPDIVAGGLHLFRPFDRLGRVSSWVTRPGNKTPTSVSQTKNSEQLQKDKRPFAPRPNFELLDSLTRQDLQNVYETTAERIRDGDQSLEDWLVLGRAYYAYGFFTEAVECFHEAATFQSDSFQANRLYGMTLSRLGQMRKAIDQLEYTLTLAEEEQQPEIWHEIGRCYLRLEEPQEAERAFVRAGNHYASLAQLVKLRLRADRASETVAPLNTLSRLQPGTTRLFQLSAKVSAALGNESRAQHYRDRAEYNSDSMPLDPMVQMATKVRNEYGAAKLGVQAESLIEQKKWEEAVQLLERITSVYPDRDAFVLLAGAELERGNPEKSIELLEQLIEMRGIFPRALLLLGDAHQALGNTDQAVELWEQTARLRSAPALHVRLAKHYEQAGRQRDSDRQRVLQFTAKGISILRQANPTLAKQELEQAVAIDATIPKTWFYLGECRRFLGETTSAREAYNRALDFAPNHGRARAALEILAR